MRRFFFTAAATIAVMQVADAQSTDLLPLTRTCTVSASAEKDQPRLILSDTKAEDSTTTFVQIYGPTKLTGALDSLTISVAPFDATLTTKGSAQTSGAPFIRAYISNGWAALLDRIAKGEKLSMSAGDETITVSLIGSGAAVASIRRCSK